MAAKKTTKGKAPSTVYLEWGSEDFEDEPIVYSDKAELQSCMESRDEDNFGETTIVYEYKLVKSYKVCVEHTEKFVMEEN